jgi:hypothetical protein
MIERPINLFRPSMRAGPPCGSREAYFTELGVKFETPGRPSQSCSARVFTFRELLRCNGIGRDLHLTHWVQGCLVQGAARDRSVWDRIRLGNQPSSRTICCGVGNRTPQFPLLCSRGHRIIRCVADR